MISPEEDYHQTAHILVKFVRETETSGVLPFCA